MKKSTKYSIARLVVVGVLCLATGFGLGWISKKTEIVEVNITRPVEYIEVECVSCENKVEPTYKEMWVIATAYCPCKKCCGKSDGITSTGVKAKANRTVAVDPKVIPYGSEVIIDGNTYIAEDCGGAIKGNRVDIFFDDHTSALEFGVKNLYAYVVYNE